LFVLGRLEINILKMLVATPKDRASSISGMQCCVCLKLILASMAATSQWLVSEKASIRILAGGGASMCAKESRIRCGRCKKKSTAWW
jgi:hypothetical protein